jgi:hypothetical protein
MAYYHGVIVWQAKRKKRFIIGNNVLINIKKKYDGLLMTIAGRLFMLSIVVGPTV